MIFPSVCIDPGAASNRSGTSKETNMRSVTFRMICRVLIAPVMALSVQTARAGMIGADQVSLAAAAQTERNTVLNALGRPAVTSGLQALGVDPQAARDRVAAMSDEELDALAGKMNSLALGAVPFCPQEDYQCGPAALATTLVESGVKVTPQDLVAQVYIPERQGSLQVEMLAAPRRYGIASYQLAPRLDDLLREVAAGNPVIVLQNNGFGPFPVWHYAVVIGYDYPRGELYLRSGEKPRVSVPFTVLEYTWKKSDYWAMVTLPPGRIPVTATESGYLRAIVAMDRVASDSAATVAYAAFLRRWPDNPTASIGLAN